MEAAVSDRPEWTELPDLASRRFGGTVMWATDELFAEKENLVNPWTPAHRAETFGPKGQVYDGWETRRHREPGDDQAILRLGLAGTAPRSRTRTCSTWTRSPSRPWRTAPW